MNDVLRFCAFLCLLIALPAMAFEGDYILEERFQATLDNARAGDPQAQYAVGDMYYRGRGVRSSDKEALHWYLRAARQGVLKASYKSAYIYLHSKTVHKSTRKALPWLKLSVESGNPAAMYELAMLYSTRRASNQNNKRVLTLLSKAKMAGYKPAKIAFEQAVSSLVRTNGKSSRPVLNK